LLERDDVVTVALASKWAALSDCDDDTDFAQEHGVKQR
jgi:hypothetical protein